MQYSKEEKEMWLEDWRQSGKNAWAYARENGLIPQTFVSWTKRIKETETGLVEVPTQIVLPLEHEGEILIEKGEVKIHIPLGIGGRGLRAVMEGLGAVL
jgi:transposase-like protein